jgi:NADH:ubiquinone oxidoreductase subunit 4 (subunit M)
MYFPSVLGIAGVIYVPFSSFTPKDLKEIDSYSSQPTLG